MINKEPLVSIIVNCFNGEKYLNECLNSILAQTYENYEVIFWDNESTDSSKLIFLDVKDIRFKYFSDNDHVTLYSARNKALKVTTGKYIAFLDVDDMWYPDKLEKQVKVMEENSEIGFCYSGFKFLSENSKKLNSAYNNKKLKSGYICSNLISNYNVGILTLMVNKSIVTKNKIKFDERFTIMGDTDFVLRLSKISLGIPIKFDLAIYRNHLENLSKKTSLTVKERTIWSNEMISKSIFSNKELIPFIEETKYLDFVTLFKKQIFKKAFKKIFTLRGLFFIKGIFIILLRVKNLIFEEIKSIIK